MVMEQAIQKKLSVSGDSWVTVDVYGDANAPGLVMVPGVMSDARAWRNVVNALDAWPSVAVINRRGRAPSGPLTDAYSMQTEVEDLKVVLDSFSGTSALFGWSYGGLIVLLATNERPMRQVIAYEPVMSPFSEHALPALKAAAATTDWDCSVEIVNRQISGFSTEYVDDLRSDPRTWEQLCRLSIPLYDELRALNTAPAPDQLARLAGRVDLIIGQCNRDASPYGTAFADVRAKVGNVDIHELKGQGHLGHIQAPEELGHLLSALAGLK